MSSYNDMKCELLKSLANRLETAEENANLMFGGPTEIECHIQFSDGHAFFWNGKEFEEQDG